MLDAYIGYSYNKQSFSGIEEAAKDIAAEIERLTAELAEARAEVEKYRLAAKAWEAEEHWRRLNASSSATENAVFGAYGLYEEAAARARATKGQA